ncbi:predicted protein [Lichtheimia corymbifera JMRC:FSU:9682]|uniref:F-box domain-containing protein n=1 Tax=Lichtheimia corymbifera JMRC:FSU:9682 TaxID=1263082 RepID=A0A068RYY5_9FUNG|nr:predicted protein [Lichtheimia corymbifera JMRC:FSU:9682]
MFDPTEAHLGATQQLTVLLWPRRQNIQKGPCKLIRLAPNVQSLQGAVANARLDDLFFRAHFPNLKELHIHCHPTTPRLPLIRGLQMIADSLTHLTLYDCTSLQLRDILEACPNLVFLQTSHVDAGMSLSSSSTYPKIKHLALYNQSAQARSHEDMVDVLARFPSLRILEIPPMPDSNLLPILHTHCPYLQAIFYAYTSEDFDVTILSVHPNRKGIASACLYGDDYKQDDLIRFLHLQRDSLEVIHFCGSINIHANAYWTISNGRVLPPTPDYNNPSFPRLVDLHFTNDDPSSQSSIHFHYSYFLPGIANAMTKLKHLQKLQTDILHNVDIDHDIQVDTISNDSIQQFLQHHIALGDRSTLEHVVVKMDTMEMSDMPCIRLLARMTRLKYLELLVSDVPSTCIPFMKEISQGCPSLEKLTLGAFGSMLADGLLMPLRTHPNLKCLDVGDHPLSNHNMMALCTFRNIKQLELHYPVPTDLREILQDHIPKVYICS